MTMTPREILAAQIAVLELRKEECIKGLMAKFRTVGMDATDRAAAAQARITIEQARVLRIHRETSAIDMQLLELRQAIEGL